jgi:hypothetical protein
VVLATRKSDGTIEWRRPKFAPGPYTVSARELQTLRNLAMSFRDARTSHEGYLTSWRELERFERAGRQWVLLQRPMYEYCVEMELLPDGDIGEVIPVEPERAFELAKQHGDPRTIQE